MARRRRRRSPNVVKARRALVRSKLSTAERLAHAVLSYAERKPREFAELVRATADGRLKRAVVAELSDPEVQAAVASRIAGALRRSL